MPGDSGGHPAPAVQDFYEDRFAHCYGCGRLNPEGRQIRSIVEGDEVVAHVSPRPHDISFPGFAYGGFIASVLDCHSIAAAAAAAHRARGATLGKETLRSFVTASLKVDFLSPTPAGIVVEARAKAVSISGRKVVVKAELTVAGQVRARAEVVAVEMPATIAAHGAHGDPPPA